MDDPFLQELGTGTNSAAANQNNNDDPFAAELSSGPKGKRSKVEISKSKALVGKVKDQQELEAPDSFGKELALSAAQGVLSGPSAVLNTLTKTGQASPIVTGVGSVDQVASTLQIPWVRDKVNSISSKLNDFISTISPNPDPKNPNLSAGIESAGFTAGDAYSQSKIFGTTAKVIGKTGVLSEVKLPQPLATRALSAIDKTVRSIGGSATDSEILQQAAKHLPINVAAGVGSQALQDPESLRTVKGAALAIGLSAFGSISEGRVRVKELHKRLADAGSVQEVKQIQSEIKTELVNASNLVPNPGELPTSVQAAHKRLNAELLETQRLAEARIANIKAPVIDKYDLGFSSKEPADPRIISAAENLDKHSPLIEVVNPRMKEGGRASEHMTLDQPPKPIISPTSTINAKDIPNVAGTGDMANSGFYEKPDAGVVLPNGNSIKTITVEAIKGAIQKVGTDEFSRLVLEEQGKRSKDPLAQAAAVEEVARKIVAGSSFDPVRSPNVISPENLRPNTPTERPPILTIEDVNEAYRRSVSEYNAKLRESQVSGISNWSVDQLIDHADDINKLTNLLESGLQNQQPGMARNRPISSVEPSGRSYAAGADLEGLQAPIGAPTPSNSNLLSESAPSPSFDALGRPININKANVIDSYNVKDEINKKMGDGREINNKDNKLLPKHSQNIQNQINTNTHTPWPSITALFNKLVFHLTDKQRPFKEIDHITGEKDLDKQVGVAAQLSNGSAGKAQQFLDNKPFIIDEAGNIQFDPIAKSFREILSPLTGKLDEYRRLRLALHTLDEGVQSRGIETGIDPMDARKELANASPEVLQASVESSEYQRSVLRYMQSRGLLSEKTLAKWGELYNNYVSLERVFNSDTNKGVPSAKSGTGVGQIFKRLIGSSRQIKDPILTTIEQTRLGIRAADRNYIGTKLADAALANTKSLIGVIEPIGYADRAKSPEIYGSAERLMEAAKDSGIELGMNEAMEMATSIGHQLDIKNNVLNVWRNGLIEQYRIAPEIAAAYKAMTPQNFGLFTRILGLPAQILKIGTVDNPIFAAYNFIRDSFDAQMQSNYGFKLGKDSWNGLIESIKNGSKRQEFLAAGGGMGGITSSEAISNATALRSVIPQTGIQRVLARTFHPIEALREISRPFEEAARLGEFMRAKDYGTSSQVAAFAGRTITTDFAQSGASIGALAHMTAFLNPAVQSMIKNAATFKDAPLRSAAMGVATISIPTALLWAANHGDEEISDLRKTPGGALYWYVRAKDGIILKIPKPFLYGQIFGSGIESALDKAFDNDPDIIEHWVASVKQSASFSFVPTAAQTAYNIGTNTDAYSGTPIIPTGIQGIDPQLQTTERTSNTAKLISGILHSVTNGSVNVSPIQFDYVIRSTAGQLGSDVIKGVDNVVGNKSNRNGPSNTIADLAVIGRLFARYPSQAVAPIRDFYSRSGNVETIIKTIKFLETKKPELLAGYINENKEALVLAPIYAETKAQLGELRKSVNEINNLPDEVYSRDEKRLLTDNILRSMITITRGANTAIHGIQDQIR